MDLCVAASNLRTILDDIHSSSSPLEHASTLVEFAAVCHSASTTAVNGSNDAVLAVRKALASCQDGEFLNLVSKSRAYECI